MKHIISVLLITLLVILANACTTVPADKVAPPTANVAVTSAAATVAYKEVTVSENERGIATDSAGKVKILEPGMYRLPLDTGSVAIYSIADQAYTMQGTDSIETRSSDERLINVEATIVYRVLPDKVTNLAKTFNPDQYLSGLIRPITRNSIWNVSVQSTYNDVMNTRRAEVEKEMGQQIAEQLRPFGIDVVKFSILNIISPQ